MCLEFSIESTTADSLYKAIKAEIPSSEDSINHTSYLGLFRRPIAVSIETKTISRTEEEARIQLAIWISSQINRIHQLSSAVGFVSLAHTFIWTIANETLQDATVLEDMVFPLLFVQSTTWKAYFARPSRTTRGDLTVVCNPFMCFPFFCPTN